MSNLLSIPELERLGFRILNDSLGEWVVISPKGGVRLVFKRDTERCDRFPDVYLDGPETQAFFGVVREKLSVEGEIVSEHFPLLQPYRGDYHPDKSWPKGGAIPCENTADILQSGDLKPEDT